MAGGDLREVRSSVIDTLIKKGVTGGVRITAYGGTEYGQLPAGNVYIGLTGSEYGAVSDVLGHMRFERVVPGVYLFEATTPTLEALQAEPARAEATVRPDESNDARVPHKSIAKAAAEVCRSASSVMTLRCSWDP